MTTLFSYCIELCPLLVSDSVTLICLIIITGVFTMIAADFLTSSKVYYKHQVMTTHKDHSDVVRHSCCWLILYLFS